MRVHLVGVNCNKPEEFNDKINDRIMEIESEDSGGRIVDVKFHVDLSEPAYLYALILWEPKDDEDKTRAGLREGQNRGRYKTW